MTFYDLQKNPLSPFLIRMIILLYQDKLNKQSKMNLSNLLSCLGILEIGADNKSARVNSSIYDSYNKNQFFQWVVCYHLDSLGLLYDHPRGYFEEISHIKKYWSPTTRVSIPAGFIPQTKYEFRKRKPKLSFQIDESLKFDPKSLMTITVEEVEELKRKAFLKQENHHYYLHSERNRAIKVINERRDLTSEQKKLRIARIDEKYQRNLTKYMAHVVSILEWSPSEIRNTESDIARKEKSFIDLTTKLVNLKVYEQQMTNDEQLKQFATERRMKLETERNQAEASLIQEKVRLAKLKDYYQSISAEAVAVKHQFGNPELQERYFAGIQARKDAENL
jgi:hypothetical protein